MLFQDDWTLVVNKIVFFHISFDELIFLWPILMKMLSIVQTNHFQLPCDFDDFNRYLPETKNITLQEKFKNLIENT
jgi:hypothetical protein